MIVLAILSVAQAICLVLLFLSLLDKKSPPFEFFDLPT